MSGLAGWIDHSRNLSEQGQTVAAMAEAVAHRGPDGRGGWVGTHAALAHRRLAAIDVRNGRQPVIASGRAVLMLDGMIYNFRELRRDLRGRGHRMRTDGDAEVALAAYLEWGDDFAARLEGMFAIAVWDLRAQRLVLVRDRLGVKPLCYSRLGDGLVFGSEPKAVLAHPHIDAVVDTESLREIFAHGKRPGTTGLKGLFEVRPGHVLTVEAGRSTEHRYWNVRARPHEEDLAGTVQTVRALLGEAVGSHLTGDVPVDCTLSGGVDSSALTALAAGAEGRRTLRTFAVNFAGYTENFQPHPTMRASPDAPYARLVADHVGADHTEIMMDAAILADPALHRAALVAQDVPSPLGDMDASLLAFFRSLRERGRSAVLSGETADEVFDGYFWAYDPGHSNATTFPWVSFERGHDAAAGGLGCSLIDRTLRKEMDFVGYADGHYREALTEVPLLDGEDAAARRAREITYLALTRWAPTHLDRADRLSMASGIQLRTPFCDHRLVEYVYNVPAVFKRVDGMEKSLLRSAVGDLLPEAVLTRRKSAYPTIQEAAYARALRERFTAVATDSTAPVAPLLDVEATTAALAAEKIPEGAFAWVERASMEMVLQLNDWLGLYRVGLRLD